MLLPKMLRLFVCFTEKLKWNCCLGSLILSPSTLNFLIFLSIYLILFTQINHILYPKRLVCKWNLFCRHRITMPTMFNICLIIYWNVTILWILGQSRIRSTFFSFLILTQRYVYWFFRFGAWHPTSEPHWSRLNFLIRIFLTINPCTWAFFVFFWLLAFRERERGEREKEKHWCERERNWLVKSCMRSDWGLNLQPFGVRDDAPANLATQPELGLHFFTFSKSLTGFSVTFIIKSVNIHQSHFGFKTWSGAWTLRVMFRKAVCIAAFPFSLKKIPWSLPCFFICSVGSYLYLEFFNFFSGFSFSLDILLSCMSRRKRKAFNKARVRTHRRHWRSLVELWSMSASFMQQPFWVFLFCALALSILSVYFWDSEDNKNPHASTWAGFCFVRNTRCGYLVFAQYFLKWLIAAFSSTKIWL